MLNGIYQNAFAFYPLAVLAIVLYIMVGAYFFGRANERHVSPLKKRFDKALESRDPEELSQLLENTSFGHIYNDKILPEASLSTKYKIDKGHEYARRYFGDKIMEAQSLNFNLVFLWPFAILRVVLFRIGPFVAEMLLIVTKPVWWPVITSIATCYKLGESGERRSSGEPEQPQKQRGAFDPVESKSY